MGFYQPVSCVVEAHQIDTLDYDGLMDLIRWCNGRALGPGLDEELGREPVHEDNPPVIGVPTFHGEAAARNSDWIIKGITGLFFVVNDNDFKQDYKSIQPEST